MLTERVALDLAPKALSRSKRAEAGHPQGGEVVRFVRTKSAANRIVTPRDTYAGGFDEMKL